MVILQGEELWLGMRVSQAESSRASTRLGCGEQQSPALTRTSPPSPDRTQLAVASKCNDLRDVCRVKSCSGHGSRRSALVGSAASVQDVEQSSQERAAYGSARNRPHAPWRGCWCRVLINARNLQRGAVATSAGMISQRAPDTWIRKARGIAPPGGQEGLQAPQPNLDARTRPCLSPGGSCSPALDSRPCLPRPSPSAAASSEPEPAAHLHRAMLATANETD